MYRTQTPCATENRRSLELKGKLRNHLAYLFSYFTNEKMKAWKSYTLQQGYRELQARPRTSCPNSQTK